MFGTRHVVVAWFLCSTVAAIGAPEPIQITDDTNFNYMPSLIQRQDGSRMIVYERLDPVTDFGDLMVLFSDDGVVWSAPAVIVSGPDNERHPALVQLPDASYLLCYLSVGTGNYKIHAASSEDGLVWSMLGAVDLGWDDEPLVNPTVCMEGDGSLTMTYDRLSVGGYIAHSSDGLVWDKDRTSVSDGPLNRIMRHADGTYVLSFQRRTGSSYTQIDIFTRTSPDRVNWSAETRVTYTQNSHDSYPIELADGTYAVFFATSVAGRPYDLRSQSSADGAGWADEERWFQYVGWDTQPHPLVLANGDLALTWPRGPEQIETEVHYVEVPSTTAVPASLPNGPTIEVGPNPSSHAVRISYAMPRATDARLDIYDAAGRFVRAYRPAAASGTLVWDGAGESAIPVAAGVYFVRLQVGDRSVVERVVIVR